MTSPWHNHAPQFRHVRIVSGSKKNRFTLLGFITLVPFGARDRKAMGLDEGTSTTDLPMKTAVVVAEKIEAFFAERQKVYEANAEKKRRSRK